MEYNNTDYKHISFKRNWKLSEFSALILGNCVGLLHALMNTPLEPEYNKNLLKVTFIKGAQSTTAIEGNTLSDQEVEMVDSGEKLPPSKRYQEQEVKNVLEAFKILYNETVGENKEELISTELLLRFHEMIGRDLGEHFEATPGRFRERNVVVGKYKCPKHEEVISLITEFCEWLKAEFKYEEGGQSFADVIVQAIIAHIYIEWIHPFSDGNGRTGRLVEFYILLRGGLPNIAVHLLSNHYNSTKPQYYREIEKATLSRDLSEFIEYAVLGLRDGLSKTLDSIHVSQFRIAWKAYIYDEFAKVKADQHLISFKRKRRLALNFPLLAEATLQEIPKLNAEIAFEYGAGVSERTLIRDLEELIKMKILIKDNKGRYTPNFTLLQTASFRRRDKKEILRNLESNIS